MPYPSLEVAIPEAPTEQTIIPATDDDEFDSLAEAFGFTVER